jgi:LmbE family N-acetylglucosaminyl deacetylase
MMRADEQRRGWQTLPLGTPDLVTGSGCALILAPHPDDESLGCGGLIAASCPAGQPPVVAVLTDGGMSHPESKSFSRKQLVELREAEAREATSVLGLPQDRLIFLREPDTKAPREGVAFDRVVEQLTKLVLRFGCSAIVAPWRLDPHCDHEAAALIAAEVAGRLHINHMEYPVWGWLLPPDRIIDAGTAVGWRLDIASHRSRKLKAIAAYRSQYGEVIIDDPSGFRLPSELLQAFSGRFETFLLP